MNRSADQLQNWGAGSQPAGLNRPARTSERPALGQVSRKATFSQWAAAFLLSASLEATEQGIPRDSDWRIGARGQASFSYLKSQRERSLHFEIIVHGSHVSIRLDRFSPRNSDDATFVEEFHFDGELGHTLTIWSPDLLVPKLVLDPVTKQPRGDSNTLVRPLNEGTMELRFSPIPKGGSLLPPWLAFASLPYLEGWSRGRMEKLFDLDRTQRRGPLLVPGVLKRSPQPPGVLELLITFDSRKRTLTNELFRVEEWQEFKGQTWPKRFVFELYQSHSEPKGRLLTVSEWVVDELFVPETPVTGKPQFPGRVDVKDERLDPVPLPIVGYFITNSAVPPMEVVRSMRPYAAQVEYERSRKQPKSPVTWHLVFWPILFAPAIWYPVKRYNTRRNNSKPIPTS